MNAASPSTTLVRRLANARCAVVLTGAGVSAESGIPTFRDPGGYWDRFRPEELANVHAFLRNPELVQGWYRHRRKIARNTKPNPAHVAIRDLETMIEDFTLVTQNVDDLHRGAGSDRILELHGNIMRSYCIDCGQVSGQSRESPAEEVDVDRCSDCGGLIRPDVVWFGESLPERVIDEAFRAAERADVLLSVGTSAVVYPAAGIPGAARRSGAYVAEFNVESSAISHEVDETVIGPAGVTLPRLIQAVRTYWMEQGRV